MQEQYDKKAREHAIKQKEVCRLHLKPFVMRWCVKFLFNCVERRTLTTREVKELGEIRNQVG